MDTNERRTIVSQMKMIDELKEQLELCREGLEWYAEKAESAARYTDAKNVTGQTALIVELSLDAGNKAKKILLKLV